MTHARDLRIRPASLLTAIAGCVAALSACTSAVEDTGEDRAALQGAEWTTIHPGGPAPIRSIVRRADGMLLGPRSNGPEIEVWASRDDGASWSRHGSVANNPAVGFGDVTMLRVPGTATIFCAFREDSAGSFRITVTRSDNDGDSWVFDSSVVGPSQRFVGAPALFIRNNGDMQIYYDSELLAANNGFAGHQWIAMQGRHGTTGPWTAFGVVTVSRETARGALSREGLATVVQLGGDRLIAVVEAVEPFPSGGARANVLHATESFDGGATWGLRRTPYQARIDPGTGRRYNAYAPHAIRIGNGPVGVAFCTDEDKAGPPDAASLPVDQRQCHVGFIATTSDFETWSGTAAIWRGSTRNYVPGLFERHPNDVIVTIDEFAGNQRVMHEP